MNKKSAATFLAALMFGCAGLARGAVPEVAPPPAELTVDQIVANNAAARGGLDAWRKIQCMIWTGHLESPASPDPVLPFILEQKRPNKTRFEINSVGEKSMRVFDGTRGWKARPGKNGSSDVQPFTAQEVKFAKGEPGIDGPLIDSQAKGSTVELVGIENIEGRKSYKISARLASGENYYVWIDAETFLDTKFDRPSYNAKGERGFVSVFYRDYKTIDGLKIPGIMEIGVGSARAPDRMVIEKIAINPPLDDKTFSRPGGMRRNRMAVVDIDPLGEGSQARAPAQIQTVPSQAAKPVGPAPQGDPGSNAK